MLWTPAISDLLCFTGKFKCIFINLAVHVVWLHSYASLSLQMTSNLDEEVQKMAYNFPYIAMIEGGSFLQFLVVAECIVMDDSENLTEALLNLISAYFAFNIEYLKPLYPVFLFIQHYIMDKDNQTIPPALTRVLSTLN